MKIIFILVIILFLTSCFEDKETEKKETNPCLNVVCEQYQQCLKGTCVKKQGMCATNDDCLNNQICSQNNYCIDDVVDVCENVLCSSHGVCKVSEANKPYCECERGYFANGLECIKNNVNCIETTEQTIVCGLNNNGIQKQKCENDTWINIDGCNDDDICINSSTQAIPCGLNGLGELQQECVDGNWIDVSNCSIEVKEENNYVDSKADDMFIKDDIIYTISTMLLEKEIPGTFQKHFVISKKDLNLNELNSVYFGTSEDDYNGKIFVDDSGLIYIAGTTTGSFDIELPNKGETDYFIAQLDNNLNTLWIYFDGTDKSEEVTDLMFKNNYLYYTINTNGVYSDIMDGDYNGFLIKFDVNEKSIYDYHSIHSGETDKIAGFVFDDNNEIYITGTTNGQLVNEVPNMFDIFLVKLKGNLEVKYTKYLGSFGNDIPVAIKYFGGNIFIAGTTDSSNFYGMPNQGLIDCFLMKINKDLIPQITTFGSIQNDIPTDFDINKFGDIFIGGYAQRNSNTTTLLNDNSFLYKFNSNLELNYFKEFSASLKNNKEDDRFYSIFATDDKVFIGGSTNGYFIENDGSDTANLFTVRIDNPKSCVTNEMRVVDCLNDDLLTQTITCVNNDWEVTDSCYPTPCAQNETFTESCGLNGRGEITYTCTNNEYSLSSPCIDPDTCVDSQSYQSACGYNLMGEETMECVFGNYIRVTDCSANLVQFGSELIEEGKIVVKNSQYTYIAGITTGGFNAQFTEGANDIFIVQLDEMNTILNSTMLGTIYDDNVSDMIVDDEGNIYLTGQTSYDFATNNDLYANATYISKYDSNLTLQWTYYYFLASTTRPADMFFYNNNIYVVGTVIGFEGQQAYGENDIMLFKINKSGAIEGSVYQFGSINNDLPVSVKIKNDIIYIAGETYGDISGETVTASPAGFLLKLDLSFNLLSIKQFKSDDISTNVTDMVIGSDNSIYIAGYERGNWNSQTNSGMSDVYIAKFDDTFTLQNVKLMGNSNYDYSYGLATDSSNNLHLIYSSNNGMENNTAYNIYDSNLTFLKEEMFISSSETVANDICIYNDDVYITGYTSGAFPNTTFSGGNDIFIFSKK